jgi:ABC-2 type transport system permease protein
VSARAAQHNGGRARRIGGLIRKETLQILRDPSAMIIAGALPLLLLFLFGYGVSLDLREVALCLVVEQPNAETGSLAASFANSRYFTLRSTRDRRDCENDLVAGRMKGIVVVAADFASRAARGDAAPIQVIVDGSDPNTAGLVQNYVQGVFGNWLLQQRIATAAPPSALVSVVPRFWYNPGIESRNFLLPGLVVVIMALIGTLLTALVVAREWERGTMEALMSTPIGIAELLIGKLVPYFVLGMAAMAISVATAVFVFGVPYRGSVWALLMVSSVFLASMLALGLLISTLARNQFVASQIALIGAFLPAFLLSGLIFEISSMPLPIRLLTLLLPARYFVPAMQTLFLVGDVGAVLVPSTLAMAAIAAVLFAATARNTRTRLD